VASQARRVIAIATEIENMTVMTYAARLAALSSFAVAVTLQVALAQPAEADKPFEPTVGQQGKDVVWVPTPQALVDRMLDMAKLTASDIHYDLGSGDGRTVITAAKRGATATGVEFNPKMVELSRANAAKEGVTDKATFIQGDIFQTDFSKATVITLFLLPELNERLRPTILGMKPGTRVVSNSFSMGDWQPDERAEVTEDCRGYCRALFWIVPAKVDGSWAIDQGTSSRALSLKQEYQNLTGTITEGNVITPVTAGKLKATRSASLRPASNISARSMATRSPAPPSRAKPGRQSAISAPSRPRRPPRNRSLPSRSRRVRASKRRRRPQPLPRLLPRKHQRPRRNPNRRRSFPRSARMARMWSGGPRRTRS
jgi:hypothetical protein